MEAYAVSILVSCVSALNGNLINDCVVSDLYIKLTCSKTVICMFQCILLKDPQFKRVILSVLMVLLVWCVLMYIRFRRSKHDNEHGDNGRPTDLVQTSMKDSDPSTDSAHLTANQTPETTGGLLGSKETTEKQSTTTTVRNPQGETNSKVLDDDQERVMCKICLSRKMNVVFSPCNHMVACASCSDLLDRCAVCRTPIKGTFVVYTEF
ncbi:E3 ubiquitin-protein ligase cblA-like [Ruditapes philippinarum]|uniref:E3 ubiquitin-protein ligase cblA-like n=1 Tax=Ruditapes philippinarum TaxID=129788 RepID=UPI00295B7116|nr:E3 ubiquitin-protein ligase cblA-like [Ruditapes philippinarum]